MRRNTGGSKPEPEGSIRAAAIDIGSNAIRLRIAELTPDQPRRTILELRLPVRLGLATYSAGVLDRGSIAAAVAALAQFKQLAGDNGAENYRAVATAAMRDAPNRDQLVEAVREALGLRIETITGAEEARLLFLGIPWGELPQSVVLFEQGSGSLQIAAGRPGQPRVLEALPLGALRLTLLHGAQDRITADTVATLRAFLREGLAPALARLAEDPPECLLSAGSGLCSLARIGAPDAAHLSREAAQDLAGRLSGMTVTEKVALGLSPSRAESITAAAWLAVELLEALNFPHLRSVEANLRDGILTELLGDSTRGHRL